MNNSSNKHIPFWDSYLSFKQNPKDKLDSDVIKIGDILNNSRYIFEIDFKITISTFGKSTLSIDIEKIFSYIKSEISSLDSIYILPKLD